MQQDHGPHLLKLLRRTRRQLPESPALERTIAELTPHWRELEAAIEGQILRAPREAKRLVDLFGHVGKHANAPEPQGRAARARASLSSYLGKFEESYRSYRIAESFLTGAARDGARIGRAAVLLRLGKFDEARRTCQRVRRAARGRDDSLLAAAADLNEGVALHESGGADRALKLYRRALSGFEAVGHKHLTVTTRQNLANALVLLDRWNEALPLYDRAATELADLGLRNEAARCALNRGALLAATDRLGEADQVLRSAELALRELGDPRQAALCLLERGEVLLRAGMLHEARHALQHARRGLARGTPPAERARAALLLARTHVELGEASAARRLLRAASAQETVSQHAERVELQGRIAALGGHWNRARELLETAATAYPRNRPTHRARVVSAAAHAALASGDVAAARRLAARARRTADRLELPRLQFAAQAVSFLIADHTGRRSQADVHLEESLLALETVRAGLGPDALRAALLQGREPWFARAVRHTLDGPDGSRRALEIIERFRARALLDLAATEERIVGSPDEIMELRTRLAALERATGERGLAPLLRAAPARPSARNQRRLATAERALRDAVERARPPGARHDLDLDALRGTLPARTCVLSLFSDDEGTCLFVIQRQSLHLVRTSTTRSQVANLVDTLRFRLGRFAIGDAFVSRHEARLERDTEQALQAVSNELLAPIEEVLATVADLIIIPNGPWHHVPFAALPFHGAPLVQSTAIALSPALAALEASGPLARGRPVVCGFADEHAPAIENEVDHVAAELPRAHLLKGDAATFAALRALPRPRCLHLAAHGRYRSDAPAMSGLQLHDGWLRAADIALLDLRGSLVVLSGCETGVSAVRAGDEAHGLVRGTFASGARQLIASLWSVDDQSTADLMLRFHAERRRVGSAVQALAATQASLAAEGRPAWRWAGFCVWTRTISN